MKVLAFIPARLNSKRIKFKNLQKIKGKTLIEHTYLQAKKSNLISKIILSSESKKIIDHGKKIGILHFHKRPNRMSNDNVLSSDVLASYLSKKKLSYDYVILLQPTSPLRNYHDINKSIIKIKKTKLDSLVSIYKSDRKEKFPIKVVKNLVVKFKKDEKKISNYYLNGAIYIARYDVFIKKRNFFLPKTGFILMPKKRSADIDYPKELKKLKKNSFYGKKNN